MCIRDSNWEATLNSRDSGIATGCPACKNKSQRKLTNLVSSFFPDAESEKFLPWLGGLKSGGQHLDIFVPSLNLAIEYNGRQHYEPIKFFGGSEGFKHRKKLDERKRRLCANNEIILIEWHYSTPIEEVELRAELAKHEIFIDKSLCKESSLEGLPLFALVT